ncbi:MAG TPA: hypothetical protein P5313_03715 [Spirochaetia bacterium]|nr:hypothetical protein [Spirochaetia bacterium]
MDPTRRDPEKSYLFAALGAFDAAVLSALAWAAITVLTKYQIGYMAVAVGALVGISVRWFGQGSGKAFRILSVGFALFGCVFGNYLSQVGFYLAESGAGLLDTLLSLRPAQVPAILAESFSPIDLLFYALAVFQAWKLSVAPAAPEAETAAAAEGSASDAEPRPLLPPYPPRKALAAALPFLAILAIPVYVAARSDGTARDVYDSGSPKYEGPTSWNEPHGVWKYWDESGTLLAEIEFHRGVPEGRSVHYAEDGSMSERKTWKAGFLHGPYEQFYPDGTLRAKGAYEYDRKTGPWEEYHPNGRLSSSGTMLLDLQHGTWEIRSDSGALRARTAFDQGEPSGVWEGYSEEGILTLRRDFAGGRERILYQRDGDRETVVDGEGRYVERYEDGTRAVEGPVAGGIKTGTWRDWYPGGKPRRVFEYSDGREYLKDYYLETGERAVRDGDGILSTGEEGGRIEARYENGLLTGELKTYYPDGSPLGLSTYSAGLLDGPQRTWAPGGILLVEGECRGGLRTGVWTWYEEDGSVSSTVTFAEGKKQGVQTFFEDGVLVKEEVYRDGAYVETRLRR